MATKLKLYNEALLKLGERKLSTLGDNTEPRRVLDEVYNDVVDYCLEQGFWKFAKRTTRLDYSTSVALGYGYQYAFAQPADMIRLYALSTDEYFANILNDFDEDDGHWVTDQDEIYIQYISNDPAYGWDLNAWPKTFQTYVACELAKRIAPRIAPDKEDRMIQLTKMALDDASAKDVMKAPVKFMPEGTWTASRSGGRGITGGRRDRGKRGTLIG